jgi:hypothetical protein
MAKRKKYYRRYEFRESYDGVLKVDITEGKYYKTETKYLDETTYDRFVKVANSKQFDIEILDSGYGIGWAMWKLGDRLG